MMRAIVSPSEKKDFVRLLVMILAMGAFEVVGVASILPFMSIVAEPGLIHENELLSRAYGMFGFETERSFLLATGSVVLILVATSNTISGITYWLQFKFAEDVGHALGVRLLQKYVHRPYEFFLENNSSTLGKQVLSEVRSLSSTVLLPLVQLIGRGVVSALILGLLVAVSPGLAAVTLTIFGSLYGAVFFGLKGHLTRLGQKRFLANRLRFKTANEALGTIKIVKVNRKEAYFIERFERASAVLTDVSPKYQAMSLVPRHFVETVAFGGILLILLLRLASGGGVRDWIPMLSLYALAGYRLMPALQGVFKAASTFRFNRPIVDSIYEDLQMPDTRPAVRGDTERASLSFESEISVGDLSFRYGTSVADVILDLSVTLPKNSSTAFIGATGSGKSTLVDLLMGLLRPSSGGVYVDGTKLTVSNVQSWYNMTGYVPQDVTLYDETVLRNIAFGAPESEIDEDRVRRVARMANIHDFVVSDLPMGYETVIGERGIRLSGGQRQRLGLARALYYDPDVLILDEATSALDNITEAAVMDAIAALRKTVTLIVVAHRLSTVRDCDMIHLMERGQIIASGTYDDLAADSAIFRDMEKPAAVRS